MSPNFVALPEEMHAGAVSTGTYGQGANKLVEMQVAESELVEQVEFFWQAPSREVLGPLGGFSTLFLNSTSSFCTIHVTFSSVLPPIPALLCGYLRDVQQV